VRALAYRRVIDYLTARQDPSGSWIGVSFETLLCAATLFALGVPRTDPRITRALALCAPRSATTPSTGCASCRSRPRSGTPHRWYGGS
jgi:hypothetical protein